MTTPCRNLAHSPRLAGGAMPSYSAMHERIRLAKGKASAHPCIACGEPAHEWAYDNQDPDELEGVAKNGAAVRYSVDLDRYLPMCRSCHRSLDSRNRRKTHCDHGHEFTDENTYVWGGERHCRTCRREVHRRRRQRMREAS